MKFSFFDSSLSMMIREKKPDRTDDNEPDGCTEVKKHMEKATRDYLAKVAEENAVA